MFRWIFMSVWYNQMLITKRTEVNELDKIMRIIITDGYDKLLLHLNVIKWCNILTLYLE